VAISDATAGASIFFTLDGTTPNTTAAGSTSAYTAPITVAATETINAIATATNYSPSAVASAKFTIESQVATPTFSPSGGTFTSAQTVIISTTSAGATIYYTTDGTTPTTASTQYTTPITVSTTQTIKAIAVASGFLNSNVGIATFTIGPSVTTVNLGSGFSTGSMILGGTATLNGTRLRLTDGGSYEVASAWYQTPVNIQQFVTNFSFQITGGSSSTADGFMFVIQGGSSSAIGQAGGGLGYGPDAVGGTPGIGQSVAIKFDLYSNGGEGADSTGLYTNGASPTTPAVDMTSSGVNLHTTDVFNVQMSYDGTNLRLTITDATTNATFNQTWPINIPATVGGNAAYVGFTGGTGGITAIQEIIGWTMSSAPGAAATPTFSPAAGTYTTAQTVTISDATAGATIYYTTNGTTPTTSSTKYTAPITVSTTQTVQAIAVASGYTQSAVGSASYTISSPVAATPTFSPAAGTYTTAQTVTISDATAGATIYYTTNGATPTTLSTKYTGAITVSTTQTVQAIAVATGFSTSAVGSAKYTIKRHGK
jgi:stage V sporulation protein SpoVS